jgi:hypothetical protein
VLDEAPVAAALHLHALDIELVAAAPPLRYQLRVGERAPHTLPRRIEDARTRIVTASLFHTTEERDGMLSSGTEQGLNASYAALDGLLIRPD